MVAPRRVGAREGRQVAECQVGGVLAPERRLLGVHEVARRSAPRDDQIALLELPPQRERRRLAHGALEARLRNRGIRRAAAAPFPEAHVRGDAA